MTVFRVRRLFRPGTGISIDHEASGYNRSRSRIQAIRICNPNCPADGLTAGGKFRRNACRLRNLQRWLQIPIIPIYHSAPNPAELAEPCTFASAIASPTGTSSKQPPSSLPSRTRKIPLRSRSRSPTDSARGSDAVRAGNSRSISWSGRRHDGAWSCCPIAHRLRPDSKSRSPSAAVSRSSASLSGTMERRRLRETDADVASGSHALLGIPPTSCQSCEGGGSAPPPLAEGRFHRRAVKSAGVAPAVG